MSYTTYTLESSIAAFIQSIGYNIDYDFHVVEEDYRIYVYSSKECVPSALLDACYHLYPQAVLAVLPYKEYLAIMLMPSLISC